MTAVQPRILPEQDAQEAQQERRVLCVFPRYTPSFGTFQHAYPLMPGVRAFMPPQGLLLIAAYLPKRWQVRFVDENIRRVRRRDLRWADAVFISGMHVQREAIDDINRRAHDHDKVTILGGPSVSAAPEYYPEVDILHVGELGDATDELIRRLDRSVERPERQQVLETQSRLPLEDFPTPAYKLAKLGNYLIGSVQFSSGCPFMCEFCDIPALYGRKPRLKSPDQILRELDAIVEAGARGPVYFVDDNFIANRNAAKELLPHVIRWQQERGYPLRLNCEATLDLAGCSDVLKLMREAGFTTVFCGIETPDEDALKSIQKKQNLRQPILDAVRTINDHGMEVVSGIIMGLDTDTPDTDERILRFIDASGIPMLTINLLYALPKTRLYDRLKQEGRLVDGGGGRMSNVRFKMPEEQVRARWDRCIGEAYDPANLFERFARQADTTFAKRFRPKNRAVSKGDVLMGLRILGRVLFRVGVVADYRADFWRAAGPLLKRGRIEEVIHMGFVSHHLIRFTRECLNGKTEACFYADPNRDAPPEASPAASPGAPPEPPIEPQRESAQAA